MEVYCVKEKRHTPNVKGSEKVVITKNNRKLLKVKCASCGITKTRFMPGKLGEPSRTEGSGILGDVAMSVGELAIKEGIPFLAKKSFEAGRYYASEALRDPTLQKKVINYTLNKARPVIQKAGSEMLDQISTKVRPNKRYKTDRPDLDGAGFDIHSAIGKLPKPKRGWTLPDITIQKNVRFGKHINHQQGQQTQSQCNMTWTMVFVRTKAKNTVKMKNIANTKRTKKW